MSKRYEVSVTYKVFVEASDSGEAQDLAYELFIERGGHLWEDVATDILSVENDEEELN